MLAMSIASARQSERNGIRRDVRGCVRRGLSDATQGAARREREAAGARVPFQPINCGRVRPWNRDDRQRQ